MFIFLKSEFCEYSFDLYVAPGHKSQWKSSATQLLDNSIDWFISL